jgi:hypothetical protein
MSAKTQVRVFVLGTGVNYDGCRSKRGRAGGFGLKFGTAINPFSTPLIPVGPSELWDDDAERKQIPG